ncbi:hypothetical protein C1N32_20295 [Vibrio diazotrophicus]|jgi:hypothetical protein|uniref:Uncharacterized protein n=1 Tax=Vibrio diazotrophicus TaxID=685 RepID=A0A2J8HTE1_VIBDI|nr:hypothetical protein [Vibrio diazotrophicus]PNI01546.1 hypothetical protein C1N32_20295 [Vibrio diazotrophicus]RAS62847.1 hypothetical protein DET48_113123 [Vibrio diazotrophicus]
MTKHDRNFESVRNLTNILDKIIANPEHFNTKEIIQSLSSQSALAKITLFKDHHDEEVYPMSLNTQKSICGEQFIEGYIEFDKKRKLALFELKKLDKKRKLKKENTTITDKELIQILMSKNSFYTTLIDQLRDEIKKIMFNPPDNPASYYTNFNNTINLKLQHVKNISKEA